jgi:ATP-dependent RNA helicase RhlE
LDHVKQKTITLSKVEILVLDEADRMLDMGFLPDIKRILLLMPKQRQSLMFSATFSAEIKKFADSLLKQPVLVEVARSNAISELVTHVVHPVSKNKKADLLIHFLKLKDLKQVLVFVRTKQGADRLAQQLQREKIMATAIHGDRNQLQRTQALEDFKQGVVKVLVATDVAARGLDIEDLPHVINFELPNTPEDYVHRIGRTGRAGTKGDATSLVSEEEHELLAGIEKLLKTKLTVEKIEGFEPKRQTASNKTTPKNKSSERTKFARGTRSSSQTNRSGVSERRGPRKTDDPIFRHFSRHQLEAGYGDLSPV